MNITLIAIGKTAFKYLDEGIKLYQNRLKHYIKFELKIIPDVKNAGNLSEKQLKTKEGELLNSVLSKADYVVLLDENGKHFGSEEFATSLQKKMNGSVRHLVFIVGGAYGFSEAIQRIAKEKIALSLMTFSHQMVRLIFIEQLYRAMTILRGEPYHHK